MHVVLKDPASKLRLDPPPTVPMATRRQLTRNTAMAANPMLSYWQMKANSTSMLQSEGVC
jgi:hypothetical protein